MLHVAIACLFLIATANRANAYDIIYRMVSKHQQLTGEAMATVDGWTGDAVGWQIGDTVGWLTTDTDGWRTADGVC